MNIVNEKLAGGCLRIVCAGHYGAWSEGNSSARLIQDVIKRQLGREDCAIDEVIIDLTQVEYEGGDGPAWSVAPAVARGVRVTYLVRKQNREPLLLLISTVGFGRFVDVVTENV